MRLLSAFFIAVVMQISTAAVADELLIFTAKWCGPCRQLKAALEKDPSITADFTVTHIDVDESPAVARQYNVRVMPTLIILKDDGSLRRKVGFTSVVDLRKWLSSKEEYQRRRIFLRRN